jgi:hypothetical protein
VIRLIAVSDKPGNLEIEKLVPIFQMPDSRFHDLRGPSAAVAALGWFSGSGLLAYHADREQDIGEATLLARGDHQRRGR